MDETTRVRKRIKRHDDSPSGWKDMYVDVPSDFEERLPDGWGEGDDVLWVENDEYSVTGRIDAEENGGCVEVYAKLQAGQGKVTEVLLMPRDSTQKARESVRREIHSVAWQLELFDGDWSEIKTESIPRTKE